MVSSAIAQKLRNFCHVPRGDGMSCGMDTVAG